MNATISTLQTWFNRHKKRLAKIGIGLGLYEVFNWIFNNPVYMAVVAYLGLVWGGLAMTAFSFIQCGMFLVMFDLMGIDWVGATYLEDLAAKENKGRIERLLVYLIKQETKGVAWIGQVALFTALSVFVDPFVVTVHYRRKQFAGVTKRDWVILTASVFIANFYWTLRTGFLVLLAKELWQKLSHSW